MLVAVGAVYLPKDSVARLRWMFCTRPKRQVKVASLVASEGKAGERRGGWLREVCLVAPLLRAPKGPSLRAKCRDDVRAWLVFLCGVYRQLVSGLAMSGHPRQMGAQRVNANNFMHVYCYLCGSAGCCSCANALNIEDIYVQVGE